MLIIITDFDLQLSSLSVPENYEGRSESPYLFLVALTRDIFLKERFTFQIILHVTPLPWLSSIVSLHIQYLFVFVALRP